MYDELPLMARHTWAGQSLGSHIHHLAKPRILIPTEGPSQGGTTLAQMVYYNEEGLLLAAENSGNHFLTL